MNKNDEQINLLMLMHCVVYSLNSSGRKRSREIGGIEQHLAQLKRKQTEIDNAMAADHDK